jgi:hypothetical protein
MNSKTYKLYLRDLIYLIKENIHEMNPEKDNDFDIGLKLGYEQVIMMIQNQASAFQINLDDIGFNDFEKTNAKNTDL